MTEVLFSVGIGSLLTVGAATLVLAALTLRDARRTVRMAEDCIEYLREEQAHLLVSLSEELRIPQEETTQDHSGGGYRRADRSSRLPSRQEQRPIAEELEQERVRSLEIQQQLRREREGRERERRVRRDAERRIDQLKRELQELRDVRQESSPVPAGSLGGLLETHRSSGERPSPRPKAQAAGRTPRPASSPETTAQTPKEVPPREKLRLGVWIPHPDDGAGQERVPTGRAPAGDDAPVKMFRKHYDKYLENYQGYVELAEKLYRARDNGAVPPGLEEREWEKRLRRIIEGIERTTARLDILEEHNPQLATDDRVSRRASLSQRHSKLGRSEQA